MIPFTNDYITGAHPRVLERLIATNLEPLSGYGSDRYCASAIAKIRAAIGKPEAEIAFLAGGTQTNQIVIATMLAPYMGVLAATTGHINGHEAGAIESTGHKVISLPEYDGKIKAEDLQAWLTTFYADDNREHMVQPGMVYISFPTEYGTLYSRAELDAIHGVCRAFGIPLFVDGARLAYGLASPACDISLPDLADLCDVFYIGGTKCGALCGEALVFCGTQMPPHFLTQIKQHGALLAKGRLLGVQFDALFDGALYAEIGRVAMEKAAALEKVFEKHKIPFFLASPTNQKFVILEDERMKKLAETVAFSFWEKYDDTHTVLRFATCWSTTDADIAALDRALGALS